MAEDDDAASNKNSYQNTNTNMPSEEVNQNEAKHNIGANEEKHDCNDSSDITPIEAKNSPSRSSGVVRKDENPFSFRHFLKRDLSLPGNSTYENTGARPKVYANTVQHSPTKLDIYDSKRDKSRLNDTQAKENSKDGNGHHLNHSSTSSTHRAEIPFSITISSEPEQNLFMESSNTSFYHKSSTSPEPLGMPSLPDFVQDHILVEQAYLNSNAPLSVDLDNLPDFTFNTSFSAGSSSLGRRGINYLPSRDYVAAAVSASSDETQSVRDVPLDLPSGAEALGSVPLDLPPHLSLDLTESVNPMDRRNASPRSTFPLDLPPNAGVEGLRLPDFLPVHPGRTSPEPEHQDEQLQHIISELENTRSELLSERARASRLESELDSSRREADALRVRLIRMQREQLDQRVQSSHVETPMQMTDADSLVMKLKSQIKKLKEELAASQQEARSLRATQGSAGADLRRATAFAETSLRDLLSRLDQLKSLSSVLDPT